MQCETKKYTFYYIKDQVIKHYGNTLKKITERTLSNITHSKMQVLKSYMLHLMHWNELCEGNLYQHSSEPTGTNFNIIILHYYMFK
jgi:hypothetical protein